MLIAAALLLLAALYFGAVGALGLAGRLRPNRFAGVRTPATLRSEAAFALANKVAAPTVLAAAALFALGGVFTLLADGWVAAAAAAAAALTAFVTAGAGANLGIRAAALLPAPQQGPCGNSCGGCSLKNACDPSATADTSPAAGTGAP